MRFCIYRLDQGGDTAPDGSKRYTNGQWCYMTEFPTEEQAEAFIRRAAGPTQVLTLRVE